MSNLKINPYEILDFYYIEEYIMNIIISENYKKVWDNVSPNLKRSDKEFVITKKKIKMINYD